MKKNFFLVEHLKLFMLFSFSIAHFVNLAAQNPILMNNFPIYLDSGFGISPRLTSPIIVDFNNDGANEILFAYSGGFTSKIFVMESNGALMNGWPVYLNGSGVVTAAGDVNGDRYIDIVLVSTDSVYVFDYLANRIPGFPVYFQSNVADVLLYDLDNNGNLEIITTALNKAIVYNCDGSIRSGWPVILPGSDSNRVHATDLTTGDLNNDDVPEIIIPSSYCPNLCTINEINVYEPDGSKYFSSSIVSDSNYRFYATPASIFYRNDSGFIAVNTVYEIEYGSRTRTTIYNQNGNIVKRFYTSSDINTPSPITIGDVNKDSILDISFGYQNSYTFLFTIIGDLFNGWPVQSNSFWYKSPLIQNFDNKTVIITSENYADTLGGYTQNYGYLKFFNINGNQLNWSPMRFRGISTSGTMCDLNNDGTLDMVFPSVYINGTNNLFKYGAMIYAWSFQGVPYTPSNLDWPMYGHDRYRTFQHGFVPPDEPVGIQPISTNVPEKFSLYQNYPNPFNPSTTIKFDIKEPAFTKLTVFDALGRKLETLVNEKLKAGSYSLAFNGSKFSSGVYLYRVETDDMMITKRMILLK